MGTVVLYYNNLLYCSATDEHLRIYFKIKTIILWEGNEDNEYSENFVDTSFFTVNTNTRRQIIYQQFVPITYLSWIGNSSRSQRFLRVL